MHDPDTLTLRDQFALVVAAHTKPPDEYIGEEYTLKSYEAHAARCYKIADAMLRARTMKTKSLNQSASWSGPP